MRIESDFSMTNEVQVESEQSVTLTGIPQPKDTNTVGVKGEKPDIKLMLSDDVVGDVIQDLVSSSSRELSVDDHNGTILMELSHTTPDVHLSARPSQWASIFNDHRWWDESLRIHHKLTSGLDRLTSQTG
jgi:hypothetical protein